MTVRDKWTPITCAENIPPREGRSVQIAGLELAIFNLVDRFATIENRCPHQGGPLCDGIVTDTAVVCPLHSWKFDLLSGLALRAPQPACVAIFPTMVENGIVHVDLERGYRIEQEDAVA